MSRYRIVKLTKCNKSWFEVQIRTIGFWHNCLTDMLYGMPCKFSDAAQAKEALQQHVLRQTKPKLEVVEEL